MLRLLLPDAMPMSAPPKTRLEVSAEEGAAIRAAVRNADVSKLSADCAVVTLQHVDDLTIFLSDPRVSDAIYDLPRPISRDTVSAWVRNAERLRRAGEAILTVRLDEAGRIFSYSYFTVWPRCSAAEIAGAFRADRQNSGAGKSGAAHSFDWMFEELGVRLICVTAALDNVRSARVIEAAGFTPMGEREGVRADGVVRRSHYWEMSRDAWRVRKQAQ
jgi:RimJ/RimL family protein N-acetyltransferase